MTASYVNYVYSEILLLEPIKSEITSGVRPIHLLSMLIGYLTCHTYIMFSKINVYI